jgi:hypothetical protein
MRVLMNRWTILAAAAALSASATATADSWNERTMFSFSSPVMVPGATLAPGEYEFRLLDAKSNRHMVQIRRTGDSDVVATINAVPIKRLDVTGDVVLKFDPTESGSPPALRAWFYPGSRYGHQFTYPEAQAREIARRTKTVVLSMDQPGTDAETGSLRAYGPSGERFDLHVDPETTREWNEWRQSQARTGEAASREERRESTAPAIETSFEGMRVRVDELEDYPMRYLGQRISIDAEVQDVFGPRLFTIDEQSWGDLEGEILVIVPDAQAVPVREDDRITVSGTVKAYARDQVEGEWGWQATDAASESRLFRRPVLVADRIIGGDSDRAMLIRAEDAPRKGGAPHDATKTADRPVLSDIGAVASGDESLVGHRVRLESVAVGPHAMGRGFFVEHQGTSLFVLPPQKRSSPPTGSRVAISGIVLQFPDGMAERAGSSAGKDANEAIYVLATSVDRATDKTMTTSTTGS